MQNMGSNLFGDLVVQPMIRIGNGDYGQIVTKIP